MGKTRYDDQGRRVRSVKRTKKSAVCRQRRWSSEHGDAAPVEPATPARGRRDHATGRDGPPTPATPCTPAGGRRDTNFTPRRAEPDSEDSDFAPLEVEPESPRASSAPRIEGDRIVDPMYLADQLKPVHLHPTKCTGGDMKFRKEMSVNGLYSEWVYRCDACDKEMRVRPLPPRPGNEPNDLINEKCVFGALCTGNGYAHAEEWLSLMGLKYMSRNKFRKVEKKLGKIWRQLVTDMIEENGKKELEYARAKGRVVTFNGKQYFWCAVKGDGGWCMRSYGHSFFAKSGVIVIISAETGRILALFVKNSYCSTCELAKRKGVPVPEHDCARNHTGSASSMESMAIVEAFQRSIEDHGLIYKIFIGDGDSASISGIKERVAYRSLVTKIECANHATRNFCDKVHAAANDSKYALKSRQYFTQCAPGDTIPRVDRLVTGARGAIADAGELQKKRSEESGDQWKPHPEAVAQLQEDLRNLPYHVLGRHDSCAERYCTRQESEEPDVVCDAGEMLTVMADLIRDKLTVHVKSLVFNENTNDCERYMSMVAKMIGHKGIDMSRDGSYGRRCDIAALAQDKGPEYALEVMRSVQSGRTPDKPVKRLVERRSRHLTQRRLRAALAKADPNAKAPSRIKRRAAGPDGYYGDAIPDKSDEDLRARMADIVTGWRALTDTAEKRHKLERYTVGQWDNDLYREKHLELLSASKFGEVANRRDYTPCHALVKSVTTTEDDANVEQKRARTRKRKADGTAAARDAPSADGGAPAAVDDNAAEDGTLKETPQKAAGKITRKGAADPRAFGHENEPRAVAKWERDTGRTAEECGLFVDPEHPFLAATPDRLVGDSELLEVKSLCAQSQKYTNIHLDEIDCMTKDKKTGEYFLKSNHKYHHQIQGQLNITGRKTCYLLLYLRHLELATKKGEKDKIYEDLKIITITRDPQFYEKHKPKLIRFYMECILPELADSRIARKMLCRDPDYILKAIEEKAKKLREKGSK